MTSEQRTESHEKVFDADERLDKTIKPNPECVECIGEWLASYYLTVSHDAATDDICNACGKWDK